MTIRHENDSSIPQCSDDAVERIARLAGRVADRGLMEQGGDDVQLDDRFVAWLEHEARARMTLPERRANDRAAEMFAVRAQARVRAARIGSSLRLLPLRAREAPVQGDVAAVADAAASAACAPWLHTLAVAAGVGRELWDEPCDRWVELPADLTHGRYIALAVAGDSMTPHLNNGDTILVDTRTRAANDSIVVARRPEDGYVVKYVSRLGRTTMELSSFNAEYAPFTIAHARRGVVGVVVARLER